MVDFKDRGKVKVVDGRFQFDGKFHYIYPNSPIRDESGALAGVTNPRDMTYVHMYGGEATFFESLKDGKLLEINAQSGAEKVIYDSKEVAAGLTKADLTEVADKADLELMQEQGRTLLEKFKKKLK